MALGESRTLAMMSWIELGVFGVLALVFRSYGIPGIVYARVGSTIVIVAAWLLLGHVKGLHIAAFGRATARPLAATALMAAVVASASLYGATPIVVLAVKVALGAASYGAALWTLWVMSGRPNEGIEAKVTSLVMRRS